MCTQRTFQLFFLPAHKNILTERRTRTFIISTNIKKKAGKTWWTRCKKLKTEKDRRDLVEVSVSSVNHWPDVIVWGWGKCFRNDIKKTQTCFPFQILHHQTTTTTKHLKSLQCWNWNKLECRFSFVNFKWISCAKKFMMSSPSTWQTIMTTRDLIFFRIFSLSLGHDYY